MSLILLQVECSQEANAEVMREMTRKLYSQYEEKLQEEEQKHKLEKETLIVSGLNSSFHGAHHRLPVACHTGLLWDKAEGFSKAAWSPNGGEKQGINK